MALITDPGAPDATSYVTLVAFGAYAADAGVLDGTYSTDAQERALRQATLRLDLERYVGSRSDPTQALAWPRIGAPDPDNGISDTLDSTRIPWRVTVATSELALAILAGADLRAPDTSRDIKRMKADVIEVEYRDVREAGDALTRWYRVWRAIAPLVRSDADDRALPAPVAPITASQVSLLNGYRYP